MADYLDEIVSLAPAEKRGFAQRCAEEMRWMDAKLAETRALIARTPAVMPYDNGGGQKGIRSNPAYSEYEKLLSSWSKTGNMLVSMLPESQAEKPAARLDSMRERFRVVS